MNPQNSTIISDFFSFFHRGTSGEDRFHKKLDLPLITPEQGFESLVTKPFEVRPNEARKEKKENPVLSREALLIIGENGRQRFDEFKIYPPGWYGGKGKEISKWSVANFERFVKRLPELKQVRPSIFLTLDGNIALGWEDDGGKSFEIEFFPDKVEYFIEKLNEESTVGLAKIHDLADRIRGLI